MISTNDFKTGMTIDYEGNLFQVIEFQHVKPGKGQAFVRSKLRNLRTGAVIDNTFNAGEKVKRAHIEKSTMQFLYSMGEEYVFMNNETYDMVNIPAERLEWEKNFIVDNLEVDVTVFDGEVIGVSLPANVAMVITEAEPAVKGDTATGATKNAIVETGYQIRVPLFIESGETVLVSTENGDYKGRA